MDIHTAPNLPLAAQGKLPRLKLMGYGAMQSSKHVSAVVQEYIPMYLSNANAEQNRHIEGFRMDKKHKCQVLNIHVGK